MNGWIGVDLDGTLAKYDGWKGQLVIGEPIPAMVDRVKQWISEGKIVKIFTARVCKENTDKTETILAIRKWCLDNIGCYLEITSEKDWGMIELWDDRCVQVEPNTGRAMREKDAWETMVYTQAGE